ncbi:MULTISPECIES: DUF1906 domain-containing protein [Streptomyces]|uniref:Rv2525c-like glycoside hydrolase-like domain-containing protein n=2 Tax=Streptomyces spororaveus TaxID=284039 RepID=A0ABQ3TIP9_9ACTN|nr:DUF1906 domain-containing protein [Streptomyces spororaveus]GHI80270.1 hypothetical protein Sspor_58310 [Streptomyces spororaveus]
MSRARVSLPPLGRGLAVLAATAAVIGPAAVSAQAAAPTPDSKAVTFQGHRFEVPAGWDVVDLGADPTACVRFDRHAVYLGTPGSQQACPSRLVGRTEALLVEPDTSGEAAPGGTTVSEADREIVGGAQGIRVTATYAEDQALVRKILTSAGIPTSAPKTRARASAAPAAQPEASASATAATSSAALTNYTGKGFDACAAPDSATMDAWKAHSPYDAVGIYIGGRNRACAQKNLTASWVQQQASAGWRFMPIYVGAQASQITSPAAEGRSAADDAANQAASLGLGPGALLYYDMEAYNKTYSGNVLAFLSAWTEQLHARGYNSAVYSSSSSGIADLAAHASSHTMPDVVFSANWNGVADTNDPALPAWAWANHQRVHQYSGNVTETWGGKQIQIDRDYMDVALNGTRKPTNAGVYRSDEAKFYVADRSGGLYGWSGFGVPGDKPLTGDWNADGQDTFGVYRPGDSTFHLSNDNGTTAISVMYGSPGDVPLVGDWDGNGTDTIGVYHPADQTFYLSNDNRVAAYSVRMGVEGDTPMTGDWNGDGKDTVGVYRGSDQTFYLTDSQTSAPVNHQVKFGNPGDTPIKGDWNGDGTDKVGVYRDSDFFGAGKDSDQVIYSVRFGVPGDTPLTGQW